MNIFVFGTGNVAWSLIPALKKAGHNVVGVYGRTIDNVRAVSNAFGVVPVFELNKITPYADIYFIVTSDNGIVSAASALKTQHIVLHTSGTTDINVLKRFFKKCGEQRRDHVPKDNDACQFAFDGCKGNDLGAKAGAASERGVCLQLYKPHDSRIQDAHDKRRCGFFASRAFDSRNCPQGIGKRPCAVSERPCRAQRHAHS